MNLIKTCFLNPTFTKERVLSYAKPEFNERQMEERKTGSENGLSIDQVKVYVKSEFDSWQMEIVRKSLKEGFVFEQALIHARVDFRKRARNTNNNL